MAWIRTVPEDRARGLLAGIYAPYIERFGRVPNVIKAASLRPSLLAAAHGFRVAVLETDGGLGKRRGELISTRIAHLLHCHY